MKKCIFVVVTTLIFAAVSFPGSSVAQEHLGLFLGGASASVSGSSSMGFTGGLSAFAFDLDKPEVVDINFSGLINYTKTDNFGCFGFDGDALVFLLREKARLYGLLGVNAQAAKINNEDGDWKFGFSLGSGVLLSSWLGAELKYSRIQKVNLLKLQFFIF